MDLVTIAEIRAAAARLAGVTLRTPLVRFPLAEPGLLVKPESLQLTGAFKLRGAYAAISALPPERRARGVITHSSGNHAQAVACASRLLAVPATVVIPDDAPAVKADAARAFGAEVVRCAPGLAAREAATASLIARHGYTLVPPFDDPAVVAGQGTVGLEIAEDARELDLVLVPVGGGGLISGVAAAIRGLRPEVCVIGVEPALAADARDSLRQRRRVAWEGAVTRRTIADALRVERIGELPLAHLLAQVDDIVTVTEGEIRRAVRELAVRTRLVAEPGGAVAVAAALFRRAGLPAAKSTVAILSGGNIDPALLAAILDGQPP